MQRKILKKLTFIYDKSSIQSGYSRNIAQDNNGYIWQTQASVVAQLVKKKSICNAGDPGSIPGLGRIPGEEIVYPLQYSWASLVAQMVKNPPAMWETWVRSLGWEDPLEEGMATHSSILAWRIPWTEEPGGL